VQAPEREIVPAAPGCDKKGPADASTRQTPTIKLESGQ